MLTIGLSFSTSYLQSSIIAIAALHGPKEMLAVLSGQGGIGVLISGIQLLIAVVATFGSRHSNNPDNEPNAEASAKDLWGGTGLWLLATLPVAVCLVMARFLFDETKSADATSRKPLLQTSRQGDDTDPDDAARQFEYNVEAGPLPRRQPEFPSGRGQTLSMLVKNKSVYFSAAFVFAVTLVSITTFVLVH